MFFNYYPEVREMVKSYGFGREVYVKDTSAEMIGDGRKVVLETTCGSLKATVYLGGVLEGIIEDYSYDAFKGSLVIYLDELFGVECKSK